MQAPNATTAPTPMDLGMRQIMKASAYQLAKELEELVRFEELRFQMIPQIQSIPPHSQPPFWRLLKAAYEQQFYNRYEALAEYFLQHGSPLFSDVNGIGVLKSDTSRDEVIAILKRKIGWILLNAEAL